MASAPAIRDLSGDHLHLVAVRLHPLTMQWRTQATSSVLGRVAGQVPKGAIPEQEPQRSIAARRLEELWISGCDSLDRLRMTEVDFRLRRCSSQTEWIAVLSCPALQGDQWAKQQLNALYPRCVRWAVR